MRQFALRAAAAALLSVTAGCATAPGGGAAPAGRLDQRVTPLAYRLDLRIDPRVENFSGHVEIDVDIARSTRVIWLHGNQLQVIEAGYRDAQGAYVAGAYEQVLASGVSRLTFAEPLPAGAGALVFDYYAPFNPNLSGLYRAERDERWYAVSQLEAIDARRVFPSFDEPRFKTPFDVTVTARSEDVVITNAPETLVEPPRDDWRRHTFATTRPLPTYLLAFAVGPYEINDAGVLPPTGLRPAPTPLRGVATPGLAENMDISLATTQGLLEELEAYFGIPYPYRKLDIIAAPEYAFGAMENPGAIVYREFLMVFDEDAPLDQVRTSVLVHAHEMAHLWFGDLVTPAWWNDIWLNEAFASWMGNRAAAAWDPDGTYGLQTVRRALDAMDLDALSTARRIREPVARNEDILSAFDGITYRKGGGVLAMFESYVGEDAFREGVRTHMVRFADGVATSDDFMQSLADGSRRPEVVGAMRTFLDQPGLPNVHAELSCDASGPVVHLTQTRYRPLGSRLGDDQRWAAPVCVSYDVSGERRRSCTLLVDDEADLALDADACPSRLLPNAGGAGYYRFSMDRDAWAELIAGFNALPPAEALALIDNVFAAFEAGEADASTLLGAMEAAATSPDWEVAENVITTARRYRNRVMDDAGRAALSSAMSRIYAPRIASALAGEEHELLTGSLLEAGVRDWGDAGLLDHFAPIGDQLLSAFEAGDAGDITSRDVVAPALIAGVARGGENYFMRLLAVVEATGEPFIHEEGMEALHTTTNPGLARRVLESGLDGRLSSRDFSDTIVKQMQRGELRAATWAWVEDNIEAVAARLPAARVFRLPREAGRFCERERAASVRAFFAENGHHTPGYEATLARAIESIELCAALRQTQGAALSAALRN